MNGSPSVRVALFIRESGSESPCRWFYVTGIYITTVVVCVVAVVLNWVSAVVQKKVEKI